MKFRKEKKMITELFKISKTVPFSFKDCQSIVYHDVFSVCDMFDARDGVGKAELLPATGKYYYEPIKEVKHCMDSEFLLVHRF